ncbi:acetyltransferase [Pontibacillus salicampi]|uniref:Acetyltransferase n=1 Tax=Pontibacillus salicampi TaxID=1449801 RepID=A0ABV6LQE7_9BACI
MYTENDMVLVGAGGHAKVVLDVLSQLNDISVIGILDKYETGKVLGEWEIIGNDELLSDLYTNGLRKVFISIGDNAVRSKLYTYCVSLGYTSIPVISRRASVSKWSSIDQGAIIMGGAIIQPNVQIGENSIINTGAVIDHDSFVGSHCHIAPGVHMAGNVTVGKESFIGIGSSVKDGVKIGAGCVLGAGSIVVSNIPDYSLAYGSPAKVIRTLD